MQVKNENNSPDLPLSTKMSGNSRNNTGIKDEKEKCIKKALG